MSSSADWQIIVSGHALRRATERFGVRAYPEVQRDVRVALAAGRKAKRYPIGARNQRGHDRARGACRLVWSEDMGRAYLVKRIRGQHGPVWLVVTALKLTLVEPGAPSSHCAVVTA